jgi:hypothetical protein
MTHRFHCSRYASSCDMGAKTDTLSVSRRPRHDGKMSKCEGALESILYSGQEMHVFMGLCPTGVSAYSTT